MEAARIVESALDYDVHTQTHLSKNLLSFLLANGFFEMISTIFLYCVTSQGEQTLI